MKKYTTKVSTVLLSPTWGKNTIANAGSIFTGYLDSDFRSWGTDVAGADTEDAQADILELTSNGNFGDIYGSLGDPDSLCMTQGQIIEFCKSHPSLLSDCYTFFLFKIGADFFVAGVVVYSDGLRVRVHRFSDDNVWDADDRRRFVLPQLENKDTEELTLSPSDTLKIESALKMVVDAGYIVYKKIND